MMIQVCLIMQSWISLTLTAPGADRFQITTTLIKKGLDEFNDENFIELIRLENGRTTEVC